MDINRKHPFTILVLIFILGNILPIWLNINTYLLLFLSLFLIFFTTKFRSISIIIFLLLGIANGNRFFYPFSSETELYQYDLKNKIVTIEGVIEELKDKKYSQKGVILVNSLFFNGSRIDLKGRVQIFNRSKKRFKKWDKVILRGELKKGKTVKNYGGFDISSYLKTKGIFYTIDIKNSLNIVIKKGNSPPFFGNIKDNIYNYIGSKFKNIDGEGFYQSLILADRGDLDSKLKESIKNIGITHLFAISGFHIGILFLILYTIFLNIFKLGIRYTQYIDISKWSILITLSFIFIYLWVIGVPISAFRATIIISVYGIGKMLGRKFDLEHILALSALIIILIYPESIVSIGFYLSFLAVVALAIPVKWVTERYKNREISKIRLFFIQYIAVNISIFIITTPILLFRFYEISWGQLIFNIFFIPFFSFWVYPITLLFTVVNIPIFLEYNYKIFSYIVDIFSKPMLFTHPIELDQLIIAYLSIFLLLIGIKKGKKYLLLTFLFYFYIFIPIDRFDGVNIFFLSVGNGDSILIETDKNHYILIDAGSNRGGKNGKYVIEPHLKYLGVKNIDYCIITHQDEDHYGGLKHLVTKGIIKKLYITPPLNPPLDSLKVKTVEVLDKMVLNIDKIRLTLYPSTQFEDKNNNSIITLLEYMGKKVLFTGDAEKKRELTFLKRVKNLDIDILKAGHHGSKSSSSDLFLKNITPESAIISSGLNNRFNHPHKSVLKRLKNRDIVIYRTDLDGEIHININKKGKIKYITPFSN